MAGQGDDARDDMGDLKNMCDNGDKDDARDLHQWGLARMRFGR